MPRIDIATMIDRVTFEPEVWEWLDLLGAVVAATQHEAMVRDSFLADTPYRQLLVRAIQRDISTLMSIYVLLRCELIHQAAAHVRLLCEGLITLRYLAQDAAVRVPLFLDYAHVESYELAKAALAWEAERAKPAHVQQVQAVLLELQKDYDRVRQRYVFTDRKGKQRPFSTWCNTNVAEQARQCGTRIRCLYDIVYSQLSSYVHGSAWSLRRQLSYSRKHYDPRVILNDIAIVVRTTLVVWEEWTAFCDEEAGCFLRAAVAAGHSAPGRSAVKPTHLRSCHSSW